MIPRLISKGNRQQPTQGPGTLIRVQDEAYSGAGFPFSAAGSASSGDGRALWALSGSVDNRTLRLERRPQFQELYCHVEISWPGVSADHKSSAVCLFLGITPPFSLPIIPHRLWTNFRGAGHPQQPCQKGPAEVMPTRLIRDIDRTKPPLPMAS